MEYYDWHTTLSYAADVTMVVASRGIGKTYGIRVQCVKDHINSGYNFVEIVRYKSELGPVMDGYFDKIQQEFPGYAFKTERGKGFIAREVEEDEKGKKHYEWEIICYFIALTDAQNAKKRTYYNVKRIIFDEAVLERNDRYHSYLQNEYTKLANIVDTTTRERPDSTMKPHIYLLGNACDLLNPYFEMFGINRMPEFGYRWYRNKTVLLHYADPGEYAQAKLKDTVSGRMTAGTLEGVVAATNTFIENDLSMFESKPPRAKFEFGIVYCGKKIGIWCDFQEGFYYVNNKIPNNTNEAIYYITRDDASANYLAARRASVPLKGMSEAHYLNIIRYENSRVRSDFLDALAMFGL